MDSPCIKQTVCKVLKIFQYGKYLVAYVLKYHNAEQQRLMRAFDSLDNSLFVYTKYTHRMDVNTDSDLNLYLFFSSHARYASMGFKMRFKCK